MPRGTQQYENLNDEIIVNSGSSIIPIEVGFKRLHPSALAPVYAHEAGDSCADLFSVKDYIVFPDETVRVQTGIALEIPEGWGGFIHGRSGLALKNGIAVKGGVIDCNYREEVCVILQNQKPLQGFVIAVGDRIAQIEFRPVYRAAFTEVENLVETNRTGGFGSTGR